MYFLKKIKNLFSILAIITVLCSCVANSNDSTSSNKPDDHLEPLSATLDQTSEIKDHGSNISLTPNALIDFSKPINPSSITNNSIILKNSNNVTVTDYSLVAYSNKVALNIKKPLTETSKYTITISELVTDANGAHPKETIFEFTTGNKIYPVAYLLAPEDLSNASQTPNIAFDFNGQVKNVNPSTVSLEDESGTKVEITDIINSPLLGNDDNSARFYNFFPKKALLPHKHYKIHLSSDIVDLDDNPLKDTIFEFTTGEYIRPEIQLKSPRENDTDVSQNPSIEFNISGETEDFKNIDSNHIYLVDTEDSKEKHISLFLIKGDSNNNYTASVNDDSHLVLLANRKYAIVFSSEIKDGDGNHIAPDVKFTFTTGNSVIPGVSMIEPVNNASDISQKPTLAFFFAGAIGGIQNVTSDNVYLIKDGAPESNKIALNIVSNGDGLANNFVASLADDSKPLAADTTYNIVFTPDILDKYGNHIKDATYHFKTGEYIFPTASIVSPTSGATNITKHPLIQIQFSTIVNLTKNKNVLLLDDKGVPVTISDIDYLSEKKVDNVTYKNVYSFNPVDELNPNKTYTIKLTSDITDTYEEPNHLKETKFSFTTNEKNTPVASLLQPLNGDSGVSLSQLIKVRFSTPVQGASNDTIKLHEDSATGPVVTPIFPLSSTDNTVFILHVPTLKAGKDYYITFSTDISSANTDDHISKTQQPNHFKTGSNNNPTGQMVFPKPNSEQISIRTSIKLQFSTMVKNVNTFSVTLSNCKLKTYTIKISPGSSGTEFELTPDSELAGDTKYCVNIKSEIKDSLDTPILAEQFWFTTGFKVVPTVDLTSGISDVSVKGPMILKFSSPMKTSSQKIENHILLHLGSETASPVPVQITTNNNQEFKMVPAGEGLIYNKSYFITIDSGISDTDDNKFPGKTFTFQTVKELPTTMSIVSGSDGQGDANKINGSRYLPIHLEFSRPIHFASQFCGVLSVVYLYHSDTVFTGSTEVGLDIKDLGDGKHFDLYHITTDWQRAPYDLSSGIYTMKTFLPQGLCIMDDNNNPVLGPETIKLHVQ